MRDAAVVLRKGKQNTKRVLMLLSLKPSPCGCSSAPRGRARAQRLRVRTGVTATDRGGDAAFWLDASGEAPRGDAKITAACSFAD